MKMSLCGTYVTDMELLLVFERFFVWTLESLKKGSQWLMLNRWTCQTILENDKTKYFEGTKFARDEHYFQTMAEYYGYLTEEHSENKSLTFVNWNIPT